MNRMLQKGGMTLCLIVACNASYAEISVDIVANGRAHPIVLAEITEGPDPIGPFWLAYRVGAADRILNASGFERGDGPPDISVRTDGTPVAIWSYNAGSDHDIALSEWTGAAWSPIEFITVGPADELDPRVLEADDGTLYAVWWVKDAVDRVMLASKLAGASNWSAPVQVTSPTETGRRPSIIVSGGMLRVSYERDNGLPGTPLEAVVVHQVETGGFTQEFVAASTRSDRLDAILHFEFGALWLDWKQGETDFGAGASGPGGWGALPPEPLTSPSWIGVEDTRRQIRRQRLGP